MQFGMSSRFAVIALQGKDQRFNCLLNSTANTHEINKKLII
jgi:hypothetical protein